MSPTLQTSLIVDPEIKCYMPGVPRATYMPYPFQIEQGSKYFMIAYEYANSIRTIHMDNPGPNPAGDSWMGWSVGHWEGDTLVVDVTGMNDQTWFDRAGDFHSNDLHVIERWTPKSADVLNYEATIEDPIRRYFRIPGRSASRYTGIWRRTPSSWSTSACLTPKKCCTERIGVTLPTNSTPARLRGSISSPATPTFGRRH